MLEWNHVVETVFYAIAGLLAFSIKSNMEKLTSSVQELNIKMAVVIQQLEDHQTKLSAHDERLRDLETKKK
jgi:hypothetical protein